MATDSIVRARVDEHVKVEAVHVLGKMGLSVSDAIRMLLIRVVQEKALPFGVKAPNDETLAVTEEARPGEGKKFGQLHI